MFYFKIGDKKIPAEFSGKRVDANWDNRDSKTITFETLPLSDALQIFHDGIVWSIVEPYTTSIVELDENGEEVIKKIEKENEYDNSEYTLFGSLTTTFDNKIIVKMGKPTELEEAYEILYGGNA